MLYWLAELRDVFPPLDFFRYLSLRTLLAFLLGFVTFSVLAWLLARRSRTHRAVLSGAATAPVENKEGATSTALLVITTLPPTVLLCANPMNQMVGIVTGLGVAFACIGFVKDSKIGNQIRAVNPASAAVLIAVAAAAVLLIHSRSRMPWLDLIISEPIGVSWEVLFILDTFLITGTAYTIKWTAEVDDYTTLSVLIIAAPLMLASYIVGNAVYADYLQQAYVGGSGELTVVLGSILGIGLGCIWVSLNRSSVRLAAAGSFSLGGIVGATAVINRKQLWLFVCLLILLTELAAILHRAFYAKPFTRKVLSHAPLAGRFGKKM